MQPQPLPTQVYYVPGKTDQGDPFLGIGFETPQGMNWYFFVGDDIKRFVSDLREQAKQAQLGIVVAPNLHGIDGEGKP